MWYHSLRKLIFLKFAEMMSNLGDLIFQNVVSLSSKTCAFPRASKNGLKMATFIFKMWFHSLAKPKILKPELARNGKRE